METGYLLAFTTGLLGGFGHCIGMCGPIVTAYSLNARSRGPEKRGPSFLPHILYNLGRITTYSFIGSLMGLAGTFVNIAGKLAGIQNAVAIVAGLLMIAMGLSITGVMKGTGYIERHNSFILRPAKGVLDGESSVRYYPLGLLLGFLPCGLSYSAFIGAAATGGLLQGMLFVLFFGAGTVPALLLVGLLMTSLSGRMRGLVYRTSGVVIILGGLYFLFRGIRTYANL